MRGVLRRAGWSFGDQALSSLTNFALSVAVARTVDAEAFGAFGLAVTVELLLIGLVRAVASEPLVVRATTAEPDDRRRAAGDALGAALVLGVGAAGVVAAVGAAVAGPTGNALVALACTLPGLLVQDTVRYTAVAAGRPQLALVNDLLWAIVTAVAITAVVVVDAASVATLLGAWGLGAAVAAAAGAASLGCRPAPRAWRGWLREQHDLIPAYVGEFAARNASSRLTVFVVAATSGLTAVAGLRAAQVVTGPASVLLLGAPMVTVPETARLLRDDPDRVPRVLRATSAAFATLALATGLAPLALPAGWGDALFGDSWAEARPVLVAQAVLLGAMGATSGWLTGLRALGAARHSLGARLVVSVVGLAAGVTGASVAGGAGAVWGLAAAAWLGVAVWRRQFADAWAARPASSSSATANPSQAARAAGSIATLTVDGPRAAMPAESPGTGSSPTNDQQRAISPTGSATNRS